MTARDLILLALLLTACAGPWASHESQCSPPQQPLAAKPAPAPLPPPKLPLMIVPSILHLDEMP